jgi:hypothetical protein
VKVMFLPVCAEPVIAMSSALIVMGDCAAIASKQFAQLKQMLGIFADDQRTVWGRASTQK